MNVAIVGSGPAGLYVAEELARQRPGVRIDVFDALPTPYGLVRSGVAPDHLSTKNVTRAFDRTFDREHVRFLGNVTLGTDVSYDELKAAYDVVVLSIGANVDRRLGIPGEHLENVYGAAAFVGWYNGHPDCRNVIASLEGKALAVLGNGNVALDIVRIVAKTADELSESDISRHAAAVLERSAITDLYLIGRRGPVEASFTSTELAELGELGRCDIIVDPSQLPDGIGPHIGEKEIKAKERNVEILRDYAKRELGTKPVRIHFLFCAAPQAVIGEDRVRGLLLERTRIVERGRAELTGERFELPVDVVVTAIGYQTKPPSGVPFDETRGVIANDEGFVEPGVYVAGWSKHGPKGVIGTNRTDAKQLVGRIVSDFDRSPDRATKPGGDSIDALLRERKVRVVDFDAWKRIARAEQARAQNGKPSEKFTDVAEMLDAAFMGN